MEEEVQFETGFLVSQVGLEFAMYWKMDMILSPSPKFWVTKIHHNGQFFKKYLCMSDVYTWVKGSVYMHVCERDREGERLGMHVGVRGQPQVYDPHFCPI